MLVSYKWICQLAGIEATPQELAHKLTFSGIEVEEEREVGVGFDHIVVGQILTKEPVPDKAKLSLVTVDSGDEKHTVICGASNCPGPGGRVVLAKVGAQVGEIKIEPRKVGGVLSSGMLCSETELDIGTDESGIIILDELITAPVGTPIVEALDLHDWIFDIGVTPNRPDALSHRGLAREAALLFGGSYQPPTLVKAPEGGAPAGDAVRIELVETEGCPRYGGALVRGVKVAQSPFGLRYRLHNLGIRPISNLVDMTNAILLEYGQPLHAFDLGKLADSKVVIRRAQAGEKMTTLDEIEREFKDDDLLICDGKRPVAVAGVMGGSETGVTEETTDILIECAYFNPSWVRRTAKRLKLTSESSYRFERGVDPGQVLPVLDAAAAMSVELAGGTVAPGTIDCYPKAIEPLTVSFRPERFELIMGYSVPVEDMRRILSGLGAEVAGDDTCLQVVVPTARPDLEREIDLIEEIARTRGLHEIPTVLPRVQCTVPQRPDFEAERQAKRLCVRLGLDEAVNYSFVSRKLLAVLGSDQQVVTIANPLNAERSAMRTTLMAGLVEGLKRVHSRFMSGMTQFEVGRVFLDEGGELPREPLHVAALLSGPTPTWVGADVRQFDFYDAKRLALSFVEELTGAQPALQQPESTSYLHPKRALNVLVDDELVGVVGELHPDILAELKLPRGACGFELNVDRLVAARSVPRATPLSEYPPMSRDVAMVVAQQQDADPICVALKEACGPLARAVQVFDIYRGQGIDDDKKSLAFTVTYRSDERTLTDKEVEKAHRRAVEQVAVRFGASVR